MTEERLIELINKEIDGLSNTDEHRELMQIASSDEHAARLYRDLLLTSETLKGIKQVMPPPYLRSHILNSISFASAVPARRVGWLSSWMEVFRNKPMVRYGVVFASGLCVGILFLVMARPWQNQPEPDVSTVGGSMTLFSDLHRLPVLESVRFDGEGVNGVLMVHKSGGNVFIEIEVQSSDNVSIELNSDPAELRFDGIRRLPGTGGAVNVTQGKVVLSGARSEQAVVAFTSGDPAKGVVEGRLYKGNQLVHRVMLHVN